MLKSEKYSELDAGLLERECQKIADWWMTHSVDQLHGGFFGEIDARSNPVLMANKGIILNTRILWFFSEAAMYFKSAEYLGAAERAYDYLCRYFDDKQHGGVVWELDYQGRCVNGKKQTYAQAFAIYALSTYFQASGDKNALDKALDYFHLLEQHASDRRFGGYFEAFEQNWSPIDDMRLSDKDLNYPKSMNNHLHIIEAYTRLYQASKLTQVGQALAKLLDLFDRHIVLKPSMHLSLFQCEDWQDSSPGYSFGHDIESSWLLWEAAEALQQPALSGQFRQLSVSLAQTCLNEAIGSHGQVCDQLSFSDQHLHTDSYWWVQAEAIVGFLQAFQLSGSAAFKQAAERVWQFTQQQHIDREYGEWFWLARCDQAADDATYKAGFWKGPYHNGRAMMVAATLLREIAQEVPHAVAE